MIAPAGRKGGPSLFLVVICAALGYGVYLERQDVPVLERIVFGDDGGAAARPAPAVEPEPEPEPRPAERSADLEMPPLGEFSEIAGRTLFNPTRRPIETPPPPAKAQIVSPSRFTLIGVLISDGERMALIRRGAAGDYLRVNVGQQVDGWRIENILPDRVIIRKGKTKEDLILKDRTEPAPRTKRPRRKPGAKKPRVTNPK